MLRITITETPTGLRWTVQGRLVWPSVTELISHWNKVRRTRRQQDLTVSLEDVTLIDRSGEKLLRAMAHAGARFTANGVAVRHLINRLKHRAVRVPRTREVSGQIR